MTSVLRAPRALLTPISRVCCVTQYEITPDSPVTARNQGDAGEQSEQREVEVPRPGGALHMRAESSERGDRQVGIDGPELAPCRQRQSQRIAFRSQHERQRSPRALVEYGEHFGLDGLVESAVAVAGHHPDDAVDRSPVPEFGVESRKRP